MTADLALLAKSAKESDNKHNGVRFMTCEWDGGGNILQLEILPGAMLATGIHALGHPGLELQCPKIVSACV